MAENPPLDVSSANSPYTIATGDAENYPQITVEADCTLNVSGSGTDVSAVQLSDDTGSAINVVDSADFYIETAGNLDGTINVGSGGTVTEGTNLNLIAPVNFTDGTGTLFLEQANKLNFTMTSPITGFQAGDRIELNNNVTGVSYDASTQTMTISTDNGTGNLLVTGPDLSSSTSFLITHDSSGDSFITVACFLPGAMMLTEDGEKPIEEIRIGERVITQSGVAKPVKWVGRRAYPTAVAQESRHATPILIRQGALDGTLPRRDLYLSPCHAMYLDGMLVEAKDLLNGVSILRCAPETDITYWNVEFEGHEVIFVEGAATETFGFQGSRKMYDNWQEYDALYPGELAQRSRPFFAPRRDCGPEVEAVRHRIDRLAGIDRSGTPAVGVLLGWVGKMNHTVVRGWAANAGQQAEPVNLEVLLDGQVIGEVTANHMRQDRLEAGHPTGRCGFQFRLPEGLSPFERHVVQIRRTSDGAELSGSPALLEAAVRLDADGQHELGSALIKAATMSVKDVDRMLAMLFRQADIVLQAKVDLAGHRAEVTKPAAQFGWSAPIPHVANDSDHAAS